jgi:hypothetical protein
MDHGTLGTAAPGFRIYTFGDTMKRTLLILTALLVLGLPGTALARLYTGPIVPQVNDDGVEITVKVKQGHPRRVTSFEFHNVPTGSPCNGSNIFFHAMKVGHGLRFHGSGHPGRAGNTEWPPTPSLTVTIHGRFIKHARKVVGTLRIHGSGGCSGDTGSLAFSAKRAPPGT